ncbi:hypothetical protein EGI15_02070 [Chryseobacterium cucumeris]|uniref:Uncharacterized protein n=2 Tax=Chryseobacterium TaxID=59732 RepID=A0AAD0YVD5_CHRID|nr:MULTISPECIES: hypothetical protein [Chryseobacterium]AZB17646.1 hypothetical protein EG352_07620 [Chryseobacterium indologenes]ROH96603.1 hypothetical protein EGI15_02070 [Chryseobacterium cucumeris]
MLLFRTFFCFYIFTLFFVFSSDRAGKASVNIVAFKHPVRSGANRSIKKYNNVKAVEVENKSLSKYLNYFDIPGESDSCPEVLLKVVRKGPPVSSGDIFCAVKSYLHLLQLF